MSPSPLFIENITLTAGNVDSLIRALDGYCSEVDQSEIRKLLELGLPPIVSKEALSTMTGYAPGFIWSIMNRTKRHYRQFTIPKGQGVRTIQAPRVGLKYIQKWLAIHFERSWEPHVAVHGFVKGRSHISAAEVHLGSKWVVSVDIKDFFPSTNWKYIRVALSKLGYNSHDSMEILSKLCCLDDRLPQGAPTSPVLSNIALHDIDSKISDLAISSNWKFTRYADDIVVSGIGNVPSNILEQLDIIFNDTIWSLSKRKRYVSVKPQRLKVHGLLVHGKKLRLTKGYRNRIRAYRHIMNVNKIRDVDKKRIGGHLQYADYIEWYGQE